MTPNARNWKLPNSSLPFYQIRQQRFRKRLHRTLLNRPVCLLLKCFQWSPFENYFLVQSQKRNSKHKQSFWSLKDEGSDQSYYPTTTEINIFSILATVKPTVFAREETTTTTSESTSTYYPILNGTLVGYLQKIVPAFGKEEELGLFLNRNWKQKICILAPF